ncbi:cytochrome P450 [Amycolatopsis carbonis]|uniref:Cytochrome P450 n=1 Tax=Amycolatopsis carbonis TaxID=715471 RepID=A0A9Y2IAS5_9PSEU|nr:cytochrome P450 [Amycolatopsis sp. 2-15]WIX76277.1 cytochrome P450 [Amycolatopsis sp. 2-15]
MSHVLTRPERRLLHSRFAAPFVAAAPDPIRPYLRLMRVQAPIGTWLWLLPGRWTLALSPLEGWALVGDLVLFGLSAIAMRASICTVNDLVDRDIDAQVERTKSRPLPSGEVSVAAALVFAAVQLVITPALLIPTGWPAALASFPLFVVCPYVKRGTSVPQVWLGITTVNTLTMSVLALMRDPEQARKLATEPEAVPRAVEELLRYTAVIHFGMRRVATEDLDIAGTVIRAGEGVICPLQSANRDETAFPDPDVLDRTRDARKHVAFGFGIHQCVGQPLARAELRVALPELFRRFPDLRTTVPMDRIAFRDRAIVYGPVRLPVTGTARR